MNGKVAKVCAYVMTVDSGLAPNPFHGVCTLSVCTPNHMRANLNVGDWIVGVAGKRLRSSIGSQNVWRIVYAMKISKVRNLGAYYDDPEFQSKIPKLVGSRVEMCGDNFYEQTPEGPKHTLETVEHLGLEKEDTNGNRVFIGDEFYYFGSQAVEISEQERWSNLIIEKFKRCAVGLRYLSEASRSDGWGETEFHAFRSFLKQNKLERVPNPIDFPPIETQALSKTCKPSPDCSR